MNLGKRERKFCVVFWSLLSGIGLFVLSGLFFLTLSSGCTLNRAHNEAHYNQFKRDMSDIHNTVDWFIFDFDPNDPQNY